VSVYGRKISDFYDAAPVQDTDEFLIARSGTNAWQTASSIKTYTSGGTPLVLPSGITPKLWLSARTIVGLTDTQPVATWADISGQGNTATSADQPLYRTNVFGAGLPSVNFNGTSNFFTLSSLIPLTHLATIVFIGRLSNDPGPGTACLVAGHSAQNIQISYQHGNNLGIYDTSVGIQSIGFDIADTGLRMSVWQHNGQSWSFFEGCGRTRNPNTSATQLATPINQIGHGNYNGDWFFGDMGELIIYEKDLPAIEVSILWRYFLGIYSSLPA
jgi:hypothetical protein